MAREDLTNPSWATDPSRGTNPSRATDPSRTTDPSRATDATDRATAIDLSEAVADLPSTDLPKATIHGAPKPFRVQPKHAIVVFGLLSLVGVYEFLVGYTVYYPPLGLLFDLAWLGPVVLVLARKRTTTMIAVMCLFAFIGQAFVFDELDAISRLHTLRPTEIATTFGILGGLIASVITIVKPDPDPDFVPNEFTIR